jgi:rhodanese-related sulfurtransferase
MSDLKFKIWDKSKGGIPLMRSRGALASGVALALLLVGQTLIKEGPLLFAGTEGPITWDAVFAWIQRDWPEVPQMSTQELAQRMAAGNGRPRPLLIDVRTRPEYEVSHLPGAVWAETLSEIAAAVRTAPDQQTVVLYCSVGERSSKAAAELLRSGRANVFNLQGSIFRWANEGRQVVANDRAVHVVHPYNEQWGVLLNPELRPRGMN